MSDDDIDDSGEILGGCDNVVPEAQSDHSLTSREREAAYFTCAGNTMEDTATLMNCSAHGVNQHLVNIRRKWGIKGGLINFFKQAVKRGYYRFP